jgi:hypothetical protein
VALEDLYNLVLRDGADDLIGYLSALEDQKRGDAANVELARGLDVFIDVELDDLQFPGMFLGNFFYRRRQHMARAAPIGPEIHHHRLRLAGLNYVSLKTCVADCLNVICHVVPCRGVGLAGPAPRISF